MATRSFRAGKASLLREVAAQRGLLTEEEARNMVRGLGPEERDAFMGSIRYESRRRTLHGGQFCARCWLKRMHCMCDVIPHIPLEANVLLYMHAHEYGRFSNTGRLLLASFGPRAQLFVHGVREQEDAFQAALGRCAPDEALVLFPSNNAISIEQWRARFQAVDLADAVGRWSLREAVPRVPTVVVIDGTWHEARRMQHSVPPSVPRVRLDPTAPSAFALRKQSQLGRICTLEATALLLAELLGPDAPAPTQLMATFTAWLQRSVKIKGAAVARARPNEDGESPDGDDRSHDGDAGSAGADLRLPCDQ